MRQSKDVELDWTSGPIRASKLGFSTVWFKLRPSVVFTNRG